MQRHHTYRAIPTEMRALHLTDQGPKIHLDSPVPTPQVGEALIQVRMAGICTTDLQLMAGYKNGYRGILGHEFVGEVIAMPTEIPQSTSWLGQRVVGEINVGCGNCSLCARGLHKHCYNRQSLGIIRKDGVFAEYITLPANNLHPVPSEVSDEQAVFTEPLAAALQILEQVHVLPQSRVYVLGDGRLGLLVAQVLATTQCNLIVIGRHPQKLSILNSQGISTIVFENGTRNELALQPADIVVEVTGSEDGFAIARSLVRPGGTLVLKSTFTGGLPHFDISSLVVDEIQLLGSRCGPFQPALRMLANGSIDVESLIHAHYALSDGVEALGFAATKGILKVLLMAEE